jgi:integrase
VMLFEDAHWADPTTLEVLDLLIDRVKTVPLLVVLTHRPIRDGARRASLHSFRHSFAVRRLRAWHEASLDVQALLPTLSVYLGHVRPEDTYWYLTATPDLLRAAGSRFTPEGVVGGAP